MNSREEPAIARRKLLRQSLAAASSVVGASVWARTADGATCRSTPRQTEGPFYPVDQQLDKDTDLTRVEERPGKAQGQYIYLSGAVRDESCRPVAGVLVEIWQACTFGRYNHPADQSGLRLDPDFQYWGQTVSDQAGQYLFKTVVPGSYPAGEDWVRPPHIHFKTAKIGYADLTSQLYFDGHPLNDRDLILRDIPAHLRSSVMVKMEPPLPGQDPSASLCRFDITIRKIV